MLLDPNALNLLNREAEASDQGTNDALGPRLTLDFTKVLPNV